jgi:hypothetical protein
MRIYGVLIFYGLALSLSACAVTEPVVVIGQNGEILRGTTTASLSAGSFSATDGSGQLQRLRAI